jgi:hypothetical protein
LQVKSIRVSDYEETIPANGLRIFSQKLQLWPLSFVTTLILSVNLIFISLLTVFLY